MHPNVNLVRNEVNILSQYVHCCLGMFNYHWSVKRTIGRELSFQINFNLKIKSSKFQDIYRISEKMYPTKRCIRVSNVVLGLPTLPEHLIWTNFGGVRVAQYYIFYVVCCVLVFVSWRFFSVWLFFCISVWMSLLYISPFHWSSYWQ